MEQTIKMDGHEVDAGMVANLICCALEGGSNYWYVIDWEKSVEPKELWTGEGFDGFRHIQWPLSEDGRLFIESDDGGETESGFLDRDSIKKGLQLMRDSYPSTWAEFIGEEEDGGTGDRFLQLCLFGEIVFQ